MSNSLGSDQPSNGLEEDPSKKVEDIKKNEASGVNIPGLDMEVDDCDTSALDKALDSYNPEEEEIKTSLLYDSDEDTDWLNTV